ncbi:Holliday junction resolvase RuvX [bacterium]|nr:Holliday junction resolvase RuvX [bacterium]
MLIKGKALGIDYGDKRIGIAVSDNEQQMAFVRDNIKNTSKRKVIKKIKELCEQEKIILVVVGLPLNMEGENTEQTLKVIGFVNELKKAINQKIVYHDERLTTKRSDVILTSIGIRGKDRKEKIDSIAASLILQNYLDLLAKS